MVKAYTTDVGFVCSAKIPGCRSKTEMWRGLRVHVCGRRKLLQTEHLCHPCPDFRQETILVTHCVEEVARFQMLLSKVKIERLQHSSSILMVISLLQVLGGALPTWYLSEQFS